MLFWWIGLWTVSFVAAQDAEKAYDVVVVGAGLSGLSAAKRIREQQPSFSILILEARSNVGGRVMSVPLTTINGRQNVDIGAQWIGRKHTELLTLAQSLNLTVEAQPMCGQRTVIVNRSRARRAVEWSDTLGVSPSIDAVLSFTDIEKLGVISVNEFVTGMELGQSDKDGINRLLQTFYDSPDNDISPLQLLLTSASDNGTVDDLLASMGHGLGLRVKEGLGELTRRMAVDLDIRYEQEVSAVHEAEDGLVHIFSNNQQFLCRQVLIALPPVLAANISLNPAMPDSMVKFMASFGGRGVAFYFAVTFQNPFWRANNQSGQIIYTGDNDLLWLTTFDISDNNQCATSNAGTLWGIAHLSQDIPAEQRYQIYVRTIHDSLGSSSNPIDITDHQFSNDQYSRNTIGVIPPTSDVETQSFVSALYNVDESIPFSDKIHFTAAELSKVSMGMMNGAVHHGTIVADAVLAQLVAGSSDTAVNHILRDQPGTTSSFISNHVHDDSVSTSAFPYKTSSQYPPTSEDPLTTTFPSATYDFEYSTSMNPLYGLFNDDVDQSTTAPSESSTSFQYSTSSQYREGAFSDSPEMESTKDINTWSTQRDDWNLQTDSIESSTTSFAYSTTPFYAEGAFSDTETINVPMVLDGDVAVKDTTTQTQNSEKFVYQTSTHYPVTITEDVDQTPTHFSLGNDEPSTEKPLAQRMYDAPAVQPQASTQTTFNKTAEFQQIENAIQTLNNTLYQAPNFINNVRGAIDTINGTINQVPREARQSLAARLSSILNSLLNYVRK